MRLLRTSLVVETATRHLSTIDETNLDKTELASYLARVATITLFSDMEQKVHDIVRKRLAVQADKKIANFIFRTNEKILKRYKRSELADTAELFGAECKEAFISAIPEQDLKKYTNVINDRHQTAHGDGGTVTLSEVSEALQVAENILDQFEKAIS